MALLIEHQADIFRWGVWKMEESLEDLLLLLPEAHRDCYERDMQRFTSLHRKSEWLAVRVLLYTMLQEDKPIGYSSVGKPFLKDASSFISISHTNGHVAVLLSSVASVGIDIEQYRQRVHRVSERFMRSDEQVEPYQGDTTWGLLLHWSAKESLYKCLDKQDADLRTLRLFPFTPQQAGTFQAQNCGEDQPHLFTVSYRIFPDFVLTWTVNEWL